MPRIARKYCDTQYFHVIVQGYEKQNIFSKRKLIKKYLKDLIESQERFEVTILAYCIMSNHAHILVYTQDVSNLSLYMQSVNIRFAKYYNHVRENVGFVFRDRFVSEQISTRGYLYNCLNYIHRNPVKAGIVDTLEKYKYSSYGDFFKRKGVVNDKVLMLLFETKTEYMPLFQIIHECESTGLEHIRDLYKMTDKKAEKVISSIIEELAIDITEIYDFKVSKYFLLRFVELGISIRQVEKVLKIDHRRAKKLIALPGRL